jgi:DNA-binding NarL/FixJ family response regulator
MQRERIVAIPPQVVIADDHVPTRVGVREVLEAAGFAVVAEAANAWDAVEAARRHEPDLCVLDVRMPGGGITAAGEIKQTHPGIAVVMLTVSVDARDLLDALRAGAAGYLLKDMDPGRVPVALRAVVNGEMTIPRSLTPLLVKELLAH